MAMAIVIQEPTRVSAQLQFLSQTTEGVTAL